MMIEEGQGWRPRAAVGSFPYPHRTIAEIEQSDQDWLGRVKIARLSSKGPASRIDRITGLSRDLGINRPPEAVQSAFPDTSCPNCGARGWCGHNGRTPQ